MSDLIFVLWLHDDEDELVDGYWTDFKLVEQEEENLDEDESAWDSNSDGPA